MLMGGFLKGHIPWNKGTAKVLTCQNCGEDFVAQNYNTKQKCCSLKCAGLLRSGKNNPMYGKPTYGFKGKRHTEKSKGKMSKKLKGKTAWNKGLKRYWDSPSEFKKGEERISGENNPAWKGGITPLVRLIRNSFQYRQWRSDVFTRDDFTCQKCNRRGGCLHAHHKKSFALILELNDVKTIEQAEKCSELWDINNGITLCGNYHKSLRSLQCQSASNVA